MFPPNARQGASLVDACRQTSSTFAAGSGCRRSGRVRATARRGIAVVELALYLPLLLLLVFGSIDCCAMIYLDHSCCIAAYEGARTAIPKGAKDANVRAAVESILAARKVNNATITVSPASVETLASGTPISITVAAPCNSNAFIASWFFRNSSVSSAITMVKE